MPKVAPNPTISGVCKFYISATVEDFFTKFSFLQKMIQAIYAANFVTIFGLIF